MAVLRCISSNRAARYVGHLRLCDGAGGQAQGEVLSDLHLLQLSTLTWLPPPPLDPPLPPRCRHSLAICATSNSTTTDLTAANGHGSSWSPATTAVSAAKPAVASVPSSASESQQALARVDAEGADAVEPQQQRRAAWLYGGFDGSSSCSDVFQIVLPDSIGSTGQPAAKQSATPQVSLPTSFAWSKLIQHLWCSTPLLSSDGVGNVHNTMRITFNNAELERQWTILTGLQAAPPPKRVLSLDDMEDSVRAMPAWKQIKRLHAAAVEQQLDQYIDPASG